MAKFVFWRTPGRTPPCSPPPGLLPVPQLPKMPQLLRLPPPEEDDEPTPRGQFEHDPEDQVRVAPPLSARRATLRAGVRSTAGYKGGRGMEAFFS